MAGLGQGQLGSAANMVPHPPQFHRTALHRSSLEGHTDILQKLLESGATVDFRDRVRPDPARVHAGLSLLAWCSHSNSRTGGSAVPIAEVAAGRALPAQPGHGDQLGQGTEGGGIPCHDAALCSQLDCTAIHWACRGGHLDAVKLLQDHGADLNLKDKVCKAEARGLGLCQQHRHALEDQGWPCVGLAGVGVHPLWCPFHPLSSCSAPRSMWPPGPGTLTLWSTSSTVGWMSTPRTG